MCVFVSLYIYKFTVISKLKHSDRNIYLFTFYFLLLTSLKSKNKIAAFSNSSTTDGDVILISTIKKH